MLGLRRRQCTNIKTTLVQRLVRCDIWYFVREINSVEIDTSHLNHDGWTFNLTYYTLGFSYTLNLYLLETYILNFTLYLLVTYIFKQMMFHRSCLNISAAEWFVSTFRHLKLELLTQFPASNDEKNVYMCMYEVRHVAHSVGHLPTFLVSFFFCLKYEFIYRTCGALYS